MKKDSFIFKFSKQPGAKPFEGDIVRVPNFLDKTTPIGSHSFVLNGDASAVDFSDSGEAIKYIQFGNTTKFPSADKMPTGFDPDTVLEGGKNPGLHIRDLHKAGITGKGITVAIIDQALNTEHTEIKDSIIHYESIGYAENKKADYHGTAVSSLLAGKTLGVAPDTKIVYFAANNLTSGYGGEKPLKMGEVDVYFANYATALRKILFMNARLPKDKKISAVSISWGMLGANEESTKLINQLIESGVMVLTTDSYRFYGDNSAFITIDRRMNSNADDIESYDVGFWQKNIKQINNRLLVPAGGRTIAGFYNNEHYIYCGANAGMSWSTPYLVGVYALAKQIMPNLTPKHFFEIAHQTSVSNDKVGNNVIIQPQKIIERLQTEKILQQQNVEAKSM